MEKEQEEPRLQDARTEVGPSDPDQTSSDDDDPDEKEMVFVRRTASPAAPSLWFHGFLVGFALMLGFVLGVLFAKHAPF